MKYELDKIKGYGHVKMAMALAVASNQSILVWGNPKSKKNELMRCLPELLPPLTEFEKQSTMRIYSLAGLLNKDNEGKRPFRMPHQTATLEGICGGGANCRPGEVSLAHNGYLYLEDGAEFKTSILQTLIVPLRNKKITLSRAGRSTCYPADMQLAMTVNPCPCGFYGTKDRICLCSARSIENYWKKFSAPLLSEIGIRVFADEEDTTDISVEELKEMIAKPSAEFMELSNKTLERFTPKEQNQLTLIANTLKSMRGGEEPTDELILSFYQSLPISLI